MSRSFIELPNASRLAGAIRLVRERGATYVEAYTPYPVPEVEEALGALLPFDRSVRLGPSRLSAAVLVVGLAAAAGTYGLQWLLDAYLYPVDVGGRPPHFPLAFVPITFEMGVLFASLTAFVGVLAGGRLLRLWDPSREVHGIESATGTGFWLEVDGVDELTLGEIRS